MRNNYVMKDGIRVTLYFDKEVRKKLEVLSKEDRRTMSAYLEAMIDAQWEARAIRIEGRKVSVGPPI